MKKFFRVLAVSLSLGLVWGGVAGATESTGMTGVSGTTGTNGGAVYTMKEAVEQGLKANPTIEAKILAMEQAELLVGAARGPFMPTVSLYYNNSRLDNSGAVGSTDDLTNKTRSNGLRVNQNLFNGFANLHNYQKTQLQSDMEASRHQLARLELISNIQLNFLSLLKGREDLKAVKDSRERITTQLQSAQAFVKVGMAPYLNVLQNEVELARVEQDEIRVRNDIRNREIALNKFMGLEPTVPVSYVGNLRDYSGVVPYTEPEAVQLAIDNRPDLDIAKKSISVAFRQSQITMAGYMPKINVNYEQTESRKRFKDPRQRDYSREYWSVNLSVQWDVFDGGATTYTYLGDRKRTESLKKEFEDALNKARADVIGAMLDIRAASELIRASKKALEAARESYAIADKRYNTHTGTITDLLDAQSKLTRAETDTGQALTEFHSARSRLYYYVGKENVGLD